MEENVYFDNDRSYAEHLYNVVTLIWKLCEGLPAVCQQLATHEDGSFLSFLLHLAWCLKYEKFQDNAFPVLGILTALAEIPSLCAQVCQEPLFELFNDLPSEETSGHLVGLVTAYLACLQCMNKDKEAWPVHSPSRGDLLQQVIDTIRLDDVHHQRYYIKSFIPLLEMVQYGVPKVVYFSLW